VGKQIKLSKKILKFNCPFPFLEKMKIHDKPPPSEPIGDHPSFNTPIRIAASEINQDQEEKDHNLPTKEYGHAQSSHEKAHQHSLPYVSTVQDFIVFFLS
jgi:hypothetical protein